MSANRRKNTKRQFKAQDNKTSKTITESNNEKSSSNTHLMQPVEKNNPGKQNTKDEAASESTYQNVDNKIPFFIHISRDPVFGYFFSFVLAVLFYFLQANNPPWALAAALAGWSLFGLTLCVSIEQYLQKFSPHTRKIWIIYIFWFLFGCAATFYLHHHYLEKTIQSNEQLSPKKEPEKEPETIHDYFESDFKNFFSLYNSDFLIMPKGMDKYSIEVNIHFDFDSKTKFLSLYLPSNKLTELACYVPISGHNEIERLLTEGIDMQSRFSTERATEYKDLKFSGRVFIYHEDVLMNSKIDELTEKYKQNGLDVKFRSVEYVLARNQRRDWLKLQGKQPE